MGEAVHVWGQEGIWEISTPSPQFFCEPKTGQQTWFPASGRRGAGSESVMAD